MKFKNSTHQQKYFLLKSKLARDDREYIVLCYLLALIDEPAECFFDFDRVAIKEDCIMQTWQTSSTRTISRLAFNLWSWGGVNADVFATINYCGNSNIPYVVEAIRMMVE